MTFKWVYHQLLSAYGQQHWWPGDSPFEIMAGAILTQNTAWPNVEKAITNLKQQQALNPQTILHTSQTKLAEWIRPSGYFNIKAERLKHYCDWYITQGEYPVLRQWHTEKLRDALLSVKGIGPETADDILLYAFERPVFVIDAYTRRIFSRLGLVNDIEKYEELRHLFESALKHEDDKTALLNEFHALIVWHGKQHCKNKPSCEGCVLRQECDF
ncbi:MAG: endonuclease III domain-containing protein [Gammaproteobacteria bacterium]|nr:endonuclease III domain-containing protein [Gammaproteobacteria bacterium]